MAPEKSTAANLRHAIEKLEEKIRRYCSRRDGRGEKLTIAEDIKMASLEALLPADVEKHVQLNRSRLSTYDVLRSEVVLYAEATSTPAKPPTGKDPWSRADDPMDTNSFSKGKGKGKGNGKDNPHKDLICRICNKKGHIAKDCWYNNGKGGGAAGKGKGSSNNADVVCWRCGKKGHLAKDCYSNIGKGKGKNEKGKASKGKGKGKATGSLEEGGEREMEETHDAGGFDMCSVESGSTQRRCGGSDRAFAGGQSDQTKMPWIKINLDTGAAKTVHPENAEYGQKVESDEVLKFRTATDEIVSGSGKLKLEAVDEWGTAVRIPGAIGPVHKPLMAAGEVTDKGNDCWLSEDGGFVIQKGSQIQKAMRAAFEAAVQKYGYKGTVAVYKERGIYNMYVREKKPKKDLCSYEQGGADASSSGGPRQGIHP